jgi:hypothetical protein
VNAEDDPDTIALQEHCTVAANDPISCKSKDRSLSLATADSGYFETPSFAIDVAGAPQ